MIEQEEFEREPDPIDQSARVSERFLADALAKASRHKGPVATGECLYCGERVEGGLRWCDVDCARAWEEEQSARIRAGNKGA